MGEREITERVEVTERESVHVCDFCGRSSDEFDGTFNEVYRNPDVSLPRYGVSQHTTKIAERITEDIRTNGWVHHPNISVNSDEKKHYCDECHAAHLEVHNDNS